MKLVDAWIKLAVEHETLEITYYSSRTKKNITRREVEPDYYGWSKDHKNFGLWGFCRLRKAIRCFTVNNVKDWKYIGNKFNPLQNGRWMELLNAYKEKGLDKIEF